jgi:hypothetical protein
VLEKSPVKHVRASEQERSRYRAVLSSVLENAALYLMEDAKCIEVLVLETAVRQN